jgi:hypothetical protein
MLRMTRFAAVAGTMALAMAACRDAVGPVSPGPAMSPAVDETAPLVFRIIEPVATDEEITFLVPTTIPPALPIDPLLARHYVWFNPSAIGNSKLLVFMPGTKNVPASWQRLGEEAARMGYHVINLMYHNDVGVDAACRGGDKPRDCSENMRLEILDGSDRGNRVTVTPANSIYNRLAKVLLHLKENYPGEGWAKFLDEGRPKWEMITVSGQSQGAGQAALIGKLHRVARVVLFSGPPDARCNALIPPPVCLPGEVDQWVSIGETPADDYYALFHHRDNFGVGIRANLRALGLESFGAAVFAELSEPPYGGAHIITTDLMPTLGYDAPNPHQSSARDNNTPLGPDGTPRLRDAWRYLLGSGTLKNHAAAEDSEEDDS